ncbi:MAG: ABC transporter substrate binding protein [Bryobacteraceae bacterium]
MAALPLYSAFLAAGDTMRQTAVIVVFVSGVEAYLEAVDGLRAGLAKLVPSPVFIDLKSPRAEAELTASLGSGPQHVVITVGTEALMTMASRRTDAVIVATMILRSDRPASSLAVTAAPRARGVYLDLPLASLLSELRILLPGKTRCGMIRDASRDHPDPPLPERVKQQGFSLEVAECSRPEELVKVFLSLKGKADSVILFPDSSLYNNTTVRPLIQASLEISLPIVGFSASFVRAGAALGIYPDFRDVGAQTAELAVKLIAGDTSLADEGPRKLQVAVNQRVLRLLGLSSIDVPGLVTF